MKRYGVWALALALAPAATAMALWLAPKLHVSEGAAAAIAFAFAALVSVLALALAAPSPLAWLPRAGLAALSVALVVFVALGRPSPRTALILINTSLLVIAHAIGGAIGQKVQHPGHLLPACAVAAAADVASLLHPSGPSHAIASSERALSLATVGAPLAGSHDVAPAVGFGDLLFLALILGVAAAHHLSTARAAAAGALGLGAAGTFAAILKRPFPALVSIAVLTILIVPEARKIRAEDKTTVRYALAIAAAVAVGSLLRYKMSG